MWTRFLVVVALVAGCGADSDPTLCPPDATAADAAAADAGMPDAADAAWPDAAPPDAAAPDAAPLRIELVCRCTEWGYLYVSCLELRECMDGDVRQGECYRLCEGGGYEVLGCQDAC